MKDRKKEIEKVEIRPLGIGWGLNVVVKANVYNQNKVGFDFGSRISEAKKTLSANQLKEVIPEIEKLIDERGAGNVPPEWREMLKELTYGEAGK